MNPTHPPANRRRRLRLLLPLLAMLVAVGCTGTFTEGVATLYLVFRQPTGQPLSVALLSFSVSQSSRDLELLNDLAFTFPSGQQLVAVDVLDRADERHEAWVLTAETASPRLLHLHRLDLRDLPATPGATLPSLGSVQLSEADGAWAAAVDAEDASDVPTGCISSLLVSPDSDRIALWDPMDPARCSSTPGAADFARVYLLEVEGLRVVEELGVESDLLAPGIRAGVGNGLLLVRRPTASDPDRAEVLQVSFEQPRPATGSSGPSFTGLQDVAALPDGLVVLHQGDGGSGTRALTLMQGGSAGSPYAAPSGAQRLHVDPLGTTTTVLSSGGSRVGVLYPGDAEFRQVVLSGNGASIEALNDYALAGGASGGVCLIDVLVSSSSGSCDHPSRFAAELPGILWIEWTYAAPDAP